MVTRYYLPGFGLKTDMFKSLDSFENAIGIQTPHSETFEEARAIINSKVENDAVIIGYSQGARLALGAVLDSPDKYRGVVIISGHLGLQGDEKEKRRKQDLHLAALAGENGEQLFAELDRKGVFTDQIENLQEMRILDGQILKNQLEIYGLGSTPFFEDQIMTLKIPVLFISGSRDLKYTQLAQKYKKKTAFSHHRILDSDHRIPFNAPKTLSLCIDWFESHVINS